MMINWLLAISEVLTFRECLAGVRVTVLILIFWRVGGNIREILYVNGLGGKRGLFYTARVWRGRPVSLLLLLIVESIVVMGVGGLPAVIISDEINNL